ncbi:hypothetical protein DXG01_001929 [Tephrocybe rancida]|nr:hypothetical protein DXG01_001929 [Tephrocybe rancida]
MAFPKVVAFDTDWTLWQNVTTNGVWGKGPGAAAILEDNMNHVNAQTIQDKSNPQNVSIQVFGDVSRVVNDVLKNGAQLAIVARTNKALSDRALYYFNTINPADNKEESIIYLVKYDEVVDEVKTKPFRRITGWSESDPMDMLHFDDEALNNSVRIETGDYIHPVSTYSRYTQLLPAVTFKLCLNKEGLTWDIYQQAISHWLRVKNLTIPANPSAPPERRLIGYSGLSTAWINRVNVEREGIVDPLFPYRWGYCLYITDDVGIAEFFRDWELREGRESYVNEVWVRDYAVWARLNKVWIPENSGDLPQMNNMNWTAEASGQNQEARDRTIDNKWGVKAPYVMFSRHHWMPGMPIPQPQRMTEMMVYTQTHRALIDVVTLTNEKTAELVATNRTPVPFHRQIQEWNITVPEVTKAEEPEFFKVDTQGTINFLQPFVARPRLANGFRELDISKDANIRFKSTMMYFTREWTDVHVIAWDDTTLYSAIDDVFAIAPGNLQYLAGEHMRNLLVNPNDPATVRVEFDRPFPTPPKVVAFLNSLDLDKSKGWRFKTSATDIDVNGFTLHIETWGDTILYSAQVGWIAYPEDETHIFSTSVNTQEVRPSNQPQATQSKAITFRDAEFWKKPDVFVALNSIDIDNKANLRVRAYVDDVSQQGLTWHIDSWSDTVLYSAGASIIAFNP